MIVTIHNKPEDIRLTSIILEADRLRPDMLKMFFCIGCGDNILQYSGNVIMIVPGETFTKLPIIAQCRKCKTKYLINSIV